MRGRPHVLVVRPDNAGDVLLAGPAIRAVAAGAARVTVWCGPNGRAAAELLPGVDAIIEHRVDWIDPAAQVVDRGRTLGLIDDLARRGIDQAIVLTSFHQSPLPTALLLRLAGVPTVAAISDDFPGALLDVRHRVDDDIHEVERSLSLVATLGHRLPPGDHGGLQISRPSPQERRTDRDRRPDAARVVIHPGASAPARTWAPERFRSLVAAVRAAGWQVTITGGAGERALTAQIAAGQDVVDAAGTTTLAGLADVLADSAALVTGNTGPAHLAAAVGTPVVSLFAPTVPAVRWRPWGVPHELLGDHTIACAGCRAATCPLPGHPCLDVVTTGDVIAALRRVMSDRDTTLPPTVTGSPYAVGTP